MNGIHLMDALIATGQARRGLIVSGEQGSRYIDKAVNALCATTDRGAFMKLVGGLTLGDAGAALIMGPKLGPDTGFMGFMLQSQGQYSDLCTCGKRGQESPLETDMANIVEEGIKLLGAMYPVFMKKTRLAGARDYKICASSGGVQSIQIPRPICTDTFIQNAEHCD